MTHLCTKCRHSPLKHACTDRIYRNLGSLDGYKTSGDSVTACPEYSDCPTGWTKTTSGKTARQVWAVIRPDGSVLADSRFKNEANAWSVALGWPDDEEIEDAKLSGYRAVLVVVIAP